MLEKRLLFSATPIDPAIVDVTSDLESAAIDVVDSNANSTMGGQEHDGQQQHEGQQTSRLELVFVDAGIEDHQQLLENLRDSNERVDYEIYLLDAERDGIEQVTEILADYQGVDAIHLFSHGNDAKLRLGNSTIGSGNLDGYAGDLAGWQNSLSADADLLLYGCELAEGVDGQTLLQSLSELTGADVSASVDDTGHESLGGDWDLEYQVGHVESLIAIDATVPSQWVGLLTTPEIFPADETRVNGVATGVQSTTLGATSVAVDGGGNSIVVWVDQSGRDGDQSGIFAQRFDDQGNRIGSEFQVNVDGTDSQFRASVAMDDSGRFVVAYDVDFGAGGIGARLRRFEADGTAIDANDITVNTGQITGDQSHVQVATNASGQIVVTWQSTDANAGIYARMLDFSTPAVADELTTPLIQVDADANAETPAVDINDSGRVAIVWEDSSTIFGSTYDFGNTTALRTRDQLNVVSTPHEQPDVAVLANNDYIVTFRSDVFLATGIFHRYIPESGPDGGIFALPVSYNTTAYGPSIDADDAGGYVITYHRDDGDSTGIYALAYSSYGNTYGSTTQISQSTAGTQAASSVAIHDKENLVVVWSGNGDQSGQADTSGVFMRQYGTAGGNVAPVADLSAGGTHTISEGGSLTLDGSNSSDADGDTLSYAWDLDNDGIFGETDEPTTETASVTWATLAGFGIVDDGTYTIGLQVDDGKFGVSTQTTTVTVENTAPSLSVTGNASVVQGATYTLNLSATDPGDDSLTGWRVDWGDGTIELLPGTATNATHTYTVAGLTHNILVSATDEDGRWVEGSLFVGTNNAQPVQRYDALSGTFETGIGSNATLNTASDLLIGPDGMLYVAGIFSDNVERFDPASGAFDTEFVASASGGLNAPSGLAFGPDGNFYVASRSTDEILRYDGSSGAFIDVFVASGSGGLDRPEDMLFTTDGHLLVTSENSDNVLRYNASTGVFVDEFITSGLGGLNGPNSLVIGRDGYLYVASQFSNEIMRFNSSTGAFVDVFVSSGLNGPSRIRFGADDYLYVANAGAGEVLRFDFGGTLVDQFVSTSGVGTESGLAFSPSHQVTVTATANTIPSATNLNQLKAYTEDDPSVALDDIVVTDPDSGETITATLTLNLPATGALTTGTFGAATSTYNTLSGVWTVTGSVTDVNAALADVAFTPAANNDADSQITVHLEDALGDGPADGLIQLGVSPLNDPPVVDLDDDNSSGAVGVAFNAAFVEGGAPVSIADPTDAVITDVDNTTLSSLTVTITNLQDGADEVLTANTGGTSILASFSGGVLTLSGVDSIANYQQVLRTIQYENLSANPNTTTRQLNVSAHDGTGVTSFMTNLSVTAVNSEPTLDLDANDSSGQSGGDFAATFTEGSGAVLIADAADALVSDLDSATLQSLTVTITNVLDGAAETLTADTTGTGITASYAGGVLTLSGVDATANYQQVLRTVRYNNASINPDSTTRQIEFVADDGASVSNTAVARVAVISVNSAPAISVPGTQTPTEDTPWSITGISVADADLGTGSIQLRLDVGIGELTVDVGVGGGVTAGQVSSNGTGSVTITAPLAQLNATLADANGLTYLGNQNANGADTLTLTANDGIASTVETVAINMTPANDAPLAVGDQFSVRQGETLTVSASGVLTNDSDVDGDTLSVVLVSGTASGTLVFGSDGAFEFAPEPTFMGSVTFSYAVTDGIATSAPATVVIDVVPPNDLSEVTPADIQSIKEDPIPDPEPVPEKTVEDEEESQADEESEAQSPVPVNVETGVTSPPVLSGRTIVQVVDGEAQAVAMLPMRLADRSGAESEAARIANSTDSQLDARPRSRHSESSRATGAVLSIGEFDSQLLWSDLDHLGEEIKEADALPLYFAGTFAGFSSALSVGYVMWTVRGGLLATSLLAHLPAWSFVDPLLVLNELDDEEDDDDDSLQDMLDKNEQEKQMSAPMEREKTTSLNEGVPQ